MASSIAPDVPFREEPDARALQALLISCRLDLQTLRRDVIFDEEEMNNAGLSLLEGRLRRLLRRLESATATLDDIYRMAAPRAVPPPAAPEMLPNIGVLLNREADLRIKNSLQIVTMLLEKQARQAQGVEARQALQAATARIGAVARVHASLQGKRALNGTVDLREYLAAVCVASGQAFGAEEKGIILRVDLQAFSVQPDTARSIGIIVTELVTNAVRHGFPYEQAGSVRVLGAISESSYRLCIEDDGVGLPQHGNSPLAPRMGLVLVNALAAQLRAPLLVEVTRGTRYTLALPI